MAPAPVVALPAWALAFGLWHIPAVYDYAAAHPAVHRLEHASFVAAGFLVWTLLVDPARRGHLSRGRRLALIGALFALGTVLADVLIFSLTPLYPAYAAQPHRVFGLSPLHDQQLAGLVMTVEQLVALGTCAAILLLPELQAPPGDAAAGRRRGSRRDGAVPLRLRAGLSRARRGRGGALRRAPRAEGPPGNRPDRRSSRSGSLLVAVPVNSPLETLSAHYLLLAHLLQNALIADWGPPLLILGLTPAMRRGVARAGGRPLELVTHPAVALVALAGRLVRRPPARLLRLGAARRLAADPRARAARRGGARLLVAGARRAAPARGARRARLPRDRVHHRAVAVARLHLRVEPVLLVLRARARLWGMSPIRDQNLAGILMNAEQTSIFFVAFAWALLRVIAEEEAAQRRLDAAYLEGHPH